MSIKKNNLLKFYLNFKDLFLLFKKNEINGRITMKNCKMRGRYGEKDFYS